MSSEFPYISMLLDDSVLVVQVDLITLNFSLDWKTSAAPILISSFDSFLVVVSPS